MKKRLTVAVIIPVRNETLYIEGVLKALQKQTLKPDEIIVIENNSTDDTVAKAEAFEGVKVIHEKLQGNVFCRNLGFNYAKSDLLFKLDADSRPDAHWLEEYVKVLEKPDIAAVSGKIKPYEGAIRHLVGETFNFLLFPVNRLFIGGNALFGSNYGIKSSAWEKVRDAVRNDKEIWEDIDLALVLKSKNLNVAVVNHVYVGISVRSGDIGFRDSARTLLGWPRTYIPYTILGATGASFAAFGGLLFTAVVRPFVRLGYKPPKA